MENIPKNKILLTPRSKIAEAILIGETPGPEWTLFWVKYKEHNVWYKFTIKNEVLPEFIDLITKNQGKNFVRIIFKLIKRKVVITLY